MQTAVIYTRVSTDEQKEHGSSLQDQKQRLVKYCQEKGIDILRHYEDDHSAKSFKRPSFQRFIRDLNEKKIRPDLIVCVRMDRFSRNLQESLDMIQYLRDRKVELQLIESHYDLSMPENLIPYILNMALPQVENERRGLNTKRGMRQAMREGRWVSTAPRGYDKVWINGKSTLSPNDEKEFVSSAFKEFSKGLLAMDELRLDLIKKHRYISKQQFTNMLRNPVYLGKILIKSWKDEPQELVEGIHESIVSEELFYKVQELLSTKRRKTLPKKTDDPRYPLRGQLICPECGGTLTGSTSKGNGGQYSYYHCQRNDCKKENKINFPTWKAHKLMEVLFDEISLPEEVITLYLAFVKETFDKKESAKERDLYEIEKKITATQGRLKSIQDKYADDILPQLDYDSMRERYNSELNDLISEKTLLEMAESSFNKYLKDGLPVLMDLKQHFVNAEVKTKKRIVSSIFPNKLIFDGKKYRTASMNLVLESMGLTINKLGRVIKKPARNLSGWSTQAPPLGLEPRTY